MPQAASGPRPYPLHKDSEAILITHGTPAPPASHSIGTSVASEHQVVGSVRFYERREIQDVLAYLRLVSNPRDQIAFARVVN